MKKNRFSEEQIIAILKEGEAGVGLADLCRKHGMGQSTYFAWKSKYAGMNYGSLDLARQFINNRL